MGDDARPLPAHHELPHWATVMLQMHALHHSSRAVREHGGTPAEVLMAVGEPPTVVIPLHDLHPAFGAQGVTLQVCSWLPAPSAAESTSILCAVEPATEFAAVLAIVAREEQASGSWGWQWAEFAGGTASDVSQETEADARAHAERMVLAFAERAREGR